MKYILCARVRAAHFIAAAAAAGERLKSIFGSDPNVIKSRGEVSIPHSLTRRQCSAHKLRNSINVIRAMRFYTVHTMTAQCHSGGREFCRLHLSLSLAHAVDARRPAALGNVCKHQFAYVGLGQTNNIYYRKLIAERHVRKGKCISHHI
jgi:hypothetical protein